MPTTTAEPPDGTTTLGEGTGYLAELVAYQALRKAAETAGAEISGRLPDPPNARILIVDTLDLAGQHALLEVTNMQMQRTSGALKAQLAVNETLVKDTAPAAGEQQPKPALEGEAQEEQRPKALESMAAVGTVIAAAPAVIGTVSTAFEALSGLVGAAAGVVAWFRGSYDIKSRTVSIKQRTAIMLMAGAIATHEVHIAGFQPEAKSDLLAALNALIEDRLALSKSAVQVSVRAATLKDETLKALLKTAADMSTTLAAAAEEFVKGLTTAPTADAQPMLSRALGAEQLCAPYTHYLFVQVETSGGETVTEKSVWNSGRLTYVGGGVLSYVLAQRDGRVLAAGAVPVFSEMAMRKGKEATALVDVPLRGLQKTT